MVVAVVVTGSVHALDFVLSHGAEVMVDADVVHADQRVRIVSLVPLVVVATVEIDLLDTIDGKEKRKQ